MRGQIAARVVARLHVASLAAGGEEDEDGHQHQQRIAHQAEEPEQHRQPLPDRGGDPGCARVAHADRQYRPQHAAAIHGKSRDQVEHAQHHVGGGDPADQAGLRLLQLGHLRQVELRSQEEHQRQRDHHVDRGARQRHHDFLPGLLRHPLQRRHPADGQKGDVGGGDAVAASGKDVAELVQHNAHEQGDDEEDAVDRLGRTAMCPVDGRDPGEQEKERQVDAHGRAADIEQLDRPTHD